MLRPTKAFVLGAGLGTRLRPLTNDTPKPMLNIKGRPLIELIFDKLVDVGIEEIIVNTHHAPEVYKAHFKSDIYKGAKLRFIHEPVLLDTGGALKNAFQYLDKKCGVLVYNGDILSDVNLDKFLTSFANTQSPVSLVLRDFGENKNVSVNSSYVCDMRFKLKTDYEKLAQFTGIFAAKNDFFNLLEAEKKQIFSTVDIFLELIKSDPKSISAHFDNSDWNDIGTLKEYEKLR